MRPSPTRARATTRNNDISVCSNDRTSLSAMRRTTQGGIMLEDYDQAVRYLQGFHAKKHRHPLDLGVIHEDKAPLRRSERPLMKRTHTVDCLASLAMDDSYTNATCPSPSSQSLPSSSTRSLPTDLSVSESSSDGDWGHYEEDEQETRGPVNKAAIDKSTTTTTTTTKARTTERTSSPVVLTSSKPSSSSSTTKKKQSRRQKPPEQRAPPQQANRRPLMFFRRKKRFASF